MIRRCCGVQGKKYEKAEEIFAENKVMAADVMVPHVL